MITEIGIVAGDIWHHLDTHGTVTLARLIKDLKRPREFVLMSIGWLAREGHIVIVAEGKDTKIKLRKGS